jgi:hypothetical protein
VLTLVAFALPAFSADSCRLRKSPLRCSYRPRRTIPARFLGGFLLGSASLWTFVNTYDFSPDRGRPQGPPYTFKLVYWHPGLNWHHTNETNALTVVARRLDAPSAPIVFTHRAGMVGHLSAEASDEVAMMTGLDLPTGGCWEIAADIKASTSITSSLCVSLPTKSKSRNTTSVSPNS